MESVIQKTIRYVERSGEEVEQQENILVEHQIDVYVNEQLVMQCVCTPSFLEEMVLGRLYTEGLITGMDEVQSCYICEYGTRARVFVKGDIRDRIDGRNLMVPTCCTDNKGVGIRQPEKTSAENRPGYSWKKEWIFRIADCFAQDTKLHRNTTGTHSCFLAKEGEILFSSEDLGRHNALDKVVGYALKNGIDLAECMLYTSGRVPADMMRKAVRAGVPVMISKAVPTDRAIRMAKEEGITLIGAARPDRMKIYSGFQPEEEESLEEK